MPSTAKPTNKAISTLFEKYQKERLAFVQSIAELSQKESLVDQLIDADVISLIKPLLVDPNAAVQQAAAISLGRLATVEEVAVLIVENELVTQLVELLESENRHCKKAAAFVIKSLAKHQKLAPLIVDSVSGLVKAMEEFDPSVKESAVGALGALAKDSSIALEIVNAGAIPMLVACVQEPEMPLKRVSAGALADLARHTPEIAQAVIDQNTISVVSGFIHGAVGEKHVYKDIKLLRNSVLCLGAIARHTLAMAERVIDGDLFPHIYRCFKLKDAPLARASAELIAEIVKHSSSLGQLVVQTGGVAVIVDYLLTQANGAARVPGLMALGYLGAMNETIAMSVVLANGVQAIVKSLDEDQVLDKDDSPIAASWALSQLSKYSSEHAKHLTVNSALIKLLSVHQKSSQIYKQNELAEEDLKAKTKRALKVTIEKVTDITALDPLLVSSTPITILRYVIEQIAKILPKDSVAKKSFVVSGGLSRLESISMKLLDPETVIEVDLDADESKKDFVIAKIVEATHQINNCYPDEIVKFYSPNYTTELLAKLDLEATKEAQQNEVEQKEIEIKQVTSLTDALEQQKKSLSIDKLAETAKELAQ